MKRGESMDQVRIGKFISENRKKENLTQEELAMKLGVSIFRLFSIIPLIKPIPINKYCKPLSFIKP